MAKLVANTGKMIELEWLQLRKQGIGGSDASAVVGENKYSSPLMVYMDKLNLHTGDKSDRVKEAAHFGHMLEPVVRNEFIRRINEGREEQGLKLIKVQHRKAIFSHNKHDWMRTNLDGVIMHPELGKGVFEAKTAHYMLMSEWDGDDVPDAYYIQCQHNMAVMGFKYAYLAVLIGGNTYKHYYIERDDEFINDLIAIEEHFWINHILGRIPPNPNGSKSEKDALTEMYPNSLVGSDIVNLPNSSIDMIADIEAYKHTIKSLTEQQTAIENEVKLMLGEIETAFAGPHKVTWKTSENGQRRFTVKFDANGDKLKKYKDIQKVADKELKELQKDIKEQQKILQKQQKEAEKARKAHEKEVEKQLKASAKELKENNTLLGGDK